MRMNGLLDALLSLPVVHNFKVSPDKRHVAFTWANVHENLDVFIAPTDAWGSRGGFTGRSDTRSMPLSTFTEVLRPTARTPSTP